MRWRRRRRRLSVVYPGAKEAAAKMEVTGSCSGEEGRVGAVAPSERAGGCGAGGGDGEGRGGGGL